ncbi:acid phosphatase 1-like [Hibiscus syriacus]|uniref:Acid phosphatase 1-like n=1 Tax=Hibiscus syriacus TaxID=106335 RepID=A0A6A2Z6C8_HIBSY|nr:acid phosphatase 1-like [Hibiscus syriacus]
MDPCPFVHLIVESLALKLPHQIKHPGAGVYPTKAPCFCKVRIGSFQSQTALLPLSKGAGDSTLESSTSPTGFHLDALTLCCISGQPVTLCVEVYTGRMGRTCGVSSGKLVGSVQFSIDLGVSQARPAVFQDGWMKLGHRPEKPTAKLHLTVRAEPDPRFVFQFGGEPECSPVEFQIQGNIRQSVFSCKFSADRSRSRSLPLDFSNKNIGYSPVAAASVITPFVPSPGTDRVSRSNPGSWLILRPHGFSLVTEDGPSNDIPIAEATISVKMGVLFCIDRKVSKPNSSTLRTLMPPVNRFVMGSTVEGEGKVSKPMVQVGIQHVTCMADVVLFIALSAAIDLSMDACLFFSRKLRSFATMNKIHLLNQNKACKISMIISPFYCSDNQ